MSRDINMNMAVKYELEIDKLKDEKLSLIQIIETKDAEIKRLKSCLSPAYVEPRPDGRDLIMTEPVKAHVFGLRGEVERLRKALENLLNFTGTYEIAPNGKLKRRVLDEAEMPGGEG